MATKHVDADLVVHYGDACMSCVKDVPIFYAFENARLDIDSCVDSIRERFGGTTHPIYLSYDLSFTHCIDALVSALREYCPTVVKGEVKRSQNLSSSTEFDSHYIKMGYHYLDIDHIDPEGVLLFVARDGVDVTNYYSNGNLYSVLIDSTFMQATVFSDCQLHTVVSLTWHCSCSP